MRTDTGFKTHESLTPVYQDTHHDPQEAACRRMFAAKVDCHTRDLLKPSDKARLKNPLAYHRARQWFGSFPSTDFRFFVECAGFDADEYHRRVMAIHDGPESERKAALARMVVQREAV